MNFKVIKCSNVISNTEPTYEFISDVIKQISLFEGWDILSELQCSLVEWSKDCLLGDIFTTQTCCVICVMETIEDDICPYCNEEGLDYDELQPECDLDIISPVSCPKCGKKWKDVFFFCERRYD